MLFMLKRLWNSPTITSWGNKLAASTKFFLVLPLLLTRFGEVQLAAWFLFGSIMFFSSIVGAQASLILSRMVSAAYGGAEHLNAVTEISKRQKEEEMPPNWCLLERLYGAMPVIDLFNALLGGVVALVLGWFSLSPLLAGVDDSSQIWAAFGVFVFGQFALQALRRFAVTLRGLGHVPLTNRWDAIFELLSAIAGVATLALGGGILQLAIVMQVFLIAGVLRQWVLLMFVVEPRFGRVPLWSLDAEIFSWIWKPLWRSIIRALASRGATKVSAVILARNADAGTLASILLSLRLLEMLEDVAIAPIASHVPRLGKLLAQGRTEQFRAGVLRAFRLVCSLQCLGVIAIGYGGYVALDLIEAETKLLEQDLFFSLSIAYVLASQVRQTLMITVIGNNIIGVSRLVVSSICTVVLSILLIPRFPVVGFIASAYIPIVAIMNVYPIRCGCRLMRSRVVCFMREAMLLPWAVLLVFASVSMLVPFEEWSSKLSNLLKQQLIFLTSGIVG